MVEIGGGSILGSSIETAEITNNSVTYDKLGDVLKWELLETLNPNAVSTITSSTLSAKKMYFVVFKELEPSTTSNLMLQINGITTASYNVLYINNTTVTAATGQTNIFLGDAYLQQHRHSGNLIVQGKSRANANGKLNVQVNNLGFPTGNIGIKGDVLIGNAVQLETMTFLLNTGTMTGIIEIYGGD